MNEVMSAAIADISITMLVFMKNSTLLIFLSFVDGIGSRGEGGAESAMKSKRYRASVLIALCTPRSVTDECFVNKTYLLRKAHQLRELGDEIQAELG